MAKSAFVSSSTQGAQKPDASTPLERRGALLLTHPVSVKQRIPSDFSVQGLMRFLKKYQDNPADVQEASIKLRLPQFHQLKAAIKSDPLLDAYIEDKLRIDYDPASEVLFIQANLTRIAAQQDSAGEFAAQIDNGLSSRIFNKEDMEEEGTTTAGRHWERHPDGQFHHQKAAFPGVVLEISYSEDGKNLKKLAWQYIQHSNGDIKVVIRIDINYGPKPSTVSLWRAKCIREDGEDIIDVEQEIAYQPFRSSSGSPVNSTQVVRLALSDFATDELCVGLGETELHITYARLAELLARAGESHFAREHNGGVRSSRKKRRPSPVSSSPERLLSEDETQFHLDEERVAEVVHKADDNFDPLL